LNIIKFMTSNIIEVSIIIIKEKIHYKHIINIVRVTRERTLLAHTNDGASLSQGQNSPQCGDQCTYQRLK